MINLVSANRRHNTSAGFNLVEVLVTAGLLAILAAIISISFQRVWRNERVFALTAEFTTWLNSVKTYSMRRDASCQVTVNASGNFSSGDPLATVVPAECASGPGGSTGFLPSAFAIPQYAGARYTITVNPSPPSAPNNPFFYTPRGATTNAITVELRFGTINDAAVSCVQISPVLGLVRAGRMNGGSCVI